MTFVTRTDHATGPRMPRVSELPLRLEPVLKDPFIESIEAEDGDLRVAATRSARTRAR